MIRSFFLLLFFFFTSKAESQDNVASGCSRWYEVPGSDLEIECPPGHKVSVTKAFYGFWRSSGRGLCSYSRDDCTEDASHVAIAECRGKTRCEIPISRPLAAHVLASVFDAHGECGRWSDRHDYLQVFYKCDRVPEQFTLTATSCTHFYTVNDEAPLPFLDGVMGPLRNHLDIGCPQGQVIRVNNAYYGWWKDGIGRECRGHDDDCSIPSSDANFCNGRRSCRVPVARSHNSPQCGQPLFQLRVDHTDYFQVDYKCQTEK